MDPNTAKLYDRVTDLKDKDPNLEVWIGENSLTFSDGEIKRLTSN